MKVFGLFGFPVEQSLSPAIHNEAFGKEGLDWEYVLWPTHPEQLASAINDFRQNHFSGANVTIPHKETVMAYLDEISPKAQEIGAVNTLLWKGGKLLGDNTDADGFLKDLRDKNIHLKGRTVLILGAGGSSKAIFYALKQAEVALVKNWTRREKGSLSAVIKEADLIINCTPGLEAELLSTLQFRPGQILYDLVYNPEQTPLMQKALEYGAQAFNGKGMLLAQAALSFELWKQSLLIQSDVRDGNEKPLI